MSIPNWYAYLPHSSSLRHNVFFPLSKTKFFFLLVATKSDLDHSCTLCLFFPSRLTCTPQNKRPSSSLAFSKDIDHLPKAPQAGRAGGRVDNWLVDWLTLSTFFPPSFQTSPSTPSQQKKHTRPLFDARVISIVPLFPFQNKNTKAKHKHSTLPLLPLPSKKRMCDHDVSRQPNPVLTGMACALFLLWRKKVFEQGGLFGNKYQGHTPQLSISVWFSGDVMLYCVVSHCSNCWLLIRPSALAPSIKPRLYLVCIDMTCLQVSQSMRHQSGRPSWRPALGLELSWFSTLLLFEVEEKRVVRTKDQIKQQNAPECSLCLQFNNFQLPYLLWQPLFPCSTERQSEKKDKEKQ